MINKPDYCKSCIGWSWGCSGFVPSYLEGLSNGVLVLGESAGQDEAENGIDWVGKAGQYLWSNLARVGITRDGWRSANVLSCQPKVPGQKPNHLVGTPHEFKAIEHCSTFLMDTIERHKKEAREQGKTPVILALGAVAFRTVMGLKPGDQLLKESYYNYVHLSTLHDIFVVSAPHPSYLMKGNHGDLPILLFSAQRALQIAEEGFSFHEPELLLDPAPLTFHRWADGYFAELEANPTSTFLSIDIETPGKAHKSEDKLIRENEQDYFILRCSFAYNPTKPAVSVKWGSENFGVICRLLKHPNNTITGWNLNYDLPRIRHQMPVEGKAVDSMWLWHVLQSAMDKDLGFVTPFYNQSAAMWKHLSEDEPAKYNALDSYYCLTNLLGIKAHLEQEDLWQVVENHVIKLTPVLDYMSSKGLLRDEERRKTAEEHLTQLLNKHDANIKAAVPENLKQVKAYKKKPKNLEGVLVRTTLLPVKRCSQCGLENPPKTHFKSAPAKMCLSCSKKWTKAHIKVGKGKKINSCANAKMQLIEQNNCTLASIITSNEPRDEWYREIEWKLSHKSLSAYQKSKKQQAIWNKQKGAVTFDEIAIRKLLVKYPADPLYKNILDYRGIQKLRGTYIGITQPDGRIKGGLRIGADGRIHPEFTMNPSTLRLAAQNPNTMQLPRPDDELSSLPRNLVVAEDGCLLFEADYSAIEAVLTAYFANWRDGIRLAKLGVHSYLASHVLKRPADLSWPDEDLAKYFKEIKKSDDPSIKRIYNACKRTVHMSAYGGTPSKMVMSEPDTFENVAQAKWLQDIYFEVASPVRKWQLQTQELAHSQGHLRNPYGYKHSFNHVFQNVKDNYGVWVKRPGDDANATLAFLPQSTAAAIIKDAMLEMYYNHFEALGQYLRLQVHDSLVSEVPKAKLDSVRDLKTRLMTAPLLPLPLPPEWEMGTHLSIGVDSKTGERWGEVH